jgi:hypothetical protein
MAWTKAKTAIVVSVGVLLAAGTTTVVVKKHIEAKQYIIAREPWSDVGAATPKATLQSLLWAVTSGNVDRAQQLMEWDVKGAPSPGAPPNFISANERATLDQGDIAQNANKIESFRILSITPGAQPNELMVRIEKTIKNTEGMHYPIPVKLRRIGNQWHAVATYVLYPTGMSFDTPFSP